MDSENGRDTQNGAMEHYSLDVSRDRVESLWRQVLNHKNSSRSDLTAVRASRARAEMERQKASKEALEATRQTCDQLIAESERQLATAREVERAAQMKMVDADETLKQAEMTLGEANTYRENMMAEADSYRDKAMADADSHRQMTTDEADSCREKIMAEARQEAQRIRDEAMAAATQECTDLKRQVTYEVQSILNEVDAMRAAAQEEMEAQKIYAETAQIKAMSQKSCAELMGNVGEVAYRMDGEDDQVSSMKSVSSWEDVGLGEVYQAPEPTTTESEPEMVSGQQENGTYQEEAEATTTSKKSKAKNSK